MDPVTVGIVTNLLAAGLMEGPVASRRRMQAVLRRAEFYAEIDAVETEFHRALRDAIEECDAGRETGELTGVAEKWDAIVERLYGASDGKDGEIDPSERLVFEDEADAVDRIARAIAFVDGYDLDETPQLEWELKRAVTEAYRVAVESFGERIVEADLTERFVAETAIEELAELDRLQERLETLEERFTRPRFYDLYRGDEDRTRASRSIDPRTLDFVARPELEGTRECERLLVLGPGGSGKSRALAELVMTGNRDIEHVIIPRAALQSPQDLQPLRNESFEGDVLLVWDDIHAISPETGNTVFRKAVTELEDILDDDLHVLATARINQVESLPGDVWNTGSPLWSEFETAELETLGEKEIDALFDRVLADEGVAASEEVREAFVERALRTDPSPMYVTSVVETAESERLTMEDIEVLPEDSLAIWQEQYADIKAANDERRFVLWAVKLLYELNVPYYYHSLLQGIYTHVLSRDKLKLGPPIEKLCQHHWLVPATSDEGAITYTIHDVKVESIDESIDGPISALSTFLLEKVGQYLPSGESNIEHVLHGNFVWLLPENPKRQGDLLAKKHYKRALAIDPEYALGHHNYAFHLHANLDKPEKAEYHYKRALAIDPEHPVTPIVYAKLLKDELSEPEKAERQYERALAIDSDDPLANYEYALFLIDEFEDLEKAKTHFEMAIQYWYNAGIIEDALHDLRVLIRVCRAMDDEDAAIEYCERAIDIADDQNDDLLWFKSVHAILSKTDPRRRYTYGLVNVLEADFYTAIELFMPVFKVKNEYPINSENYQMSLAAGVALAASVKLLDDLGTYHIHNEILNSIDPSQLEPPASILFEFIDMGTTEAIELPDGPTDQSTAELPTLEPRAFSYLLERLDN